jgi:DUF1365 family protein
VNSAIYSGMLMHARRTPRRNVFRYPVSYFLLDLDEVLALAGDPSITRVLMLAQLRVLGYVFNPVSFYWCYREDGSLACVVSELNNTFGERLPEVLRGPELRYEQRKRLHVSPFFGLDQSYEYAFSQPGEEVWARIHVRDDDGSRPLTAVLHGHRRELTNATLAWMLVRYPLMPLQVMALIHWQALRLDPRARAREARGGRARGDAARRLGPPLRQRRARTPRRGRPALLPACRDPREARLR